MNNKFKCLLVALLIIPCIVVFTACDLFGGGNSATQYTLTVQNGTGGGKYDSGASVTATATIPSGKEFVAWLEGTTQISTANPYTFTLSKNITLTATFKDIDGGDNTADNTAISNAKAALETELNGLSYSQDDVNTQVLLNAKILIILSQAESDYGVNIVQTNFVFTAAIAGTPSNQSGTNGSFTFDITVS